MSTHATTSAPASPRLTAWRLLANNRLAVAGLCLIVVIALLALLVPLLPLPDPDATAPAERLKPVLTEGHVLGTDQSTDRVVYERPDQPKWLFGSQVSEDGRFLIVSLRSGSASHNRLAYVDLQQEGWPVQPLLMAAFHIPEAKHPDQASLEVLAAILSRGQSSRLYSRLVDRDQLALDIGASVESNIDPGLFNIYMEVRPGGDREPDRQSGQIGRHKNRREEDERDADGKFQRQRTRRPDRLGHRNLDPLHEHRRASFLRGAGWRGHG